MLAPETPYAIAKIACEETIRLVALTAGWTACVLRYSTVYGAGETVPRAIPNFIRAALGGRPPVVDGDGLVSQTGKKLGEKMDRKRLVDRRDMRNLREAGGLSRHPMSATGVRMDQFDAAGPNVGSYTPRVDHSERDGFAVDRHGNIELIVMESV